MAAAERLRYYRIHMETFVCDVLPLACVRRGAISGRPKIRRARGRNSACRPRRALLVWRAEISRDGRCAGGPPLGGRAPGYILHRAEVARPYNGPAARRSDAQAIYAERVFRANGRRGPTMARLAVRTGRRYLIYRAPCAGNSPASGRRGDKRNGQYRPPRPKEPDCRRLSRKWRPVGRGAVYRRRPRSGKFPDGAQRGSIALCYIDTARGRPHLRDCEYCDIISRRDGSAGAIPRPRYLVPTENRESSSNAQQVLRAHRARLTARPK